MICSLLDDRSFSIKFSFVLKRQDLHFLFVRSFFVMILFVILSHRHSSILLFQLKNSLLSVSYQLNKCSFNFYLLTSIKITFSLFVFATTLFVLCVFIFSFVSVMLASSIETWLSLQMMLLFSFVLMSL